MQSPAVKIFELKRSHAIGFTRYIDYSSILIRHTYKQTRVHTYAQAGAIREAKVSVCIATVHT